MDEGEGSEYISEGEIPAEVVKSLYNVLKIFEGENV